MGRWGDHTGDRVYCEDRYCYHLDTPLVSRVVGPGRYLQGRSVLCLPPLPVTGVIGSLGAPGDTGRVVTRPRVMHRRLTHLLVYTHSLRRRYVPDLWSLRPSRPRVAHAYVLRRCRNYSSLAFGGERSCTFRTYHRGGPLDCNRNSTGPTTRLTSS